MNGPVLPILAPAPRISRKFVGVSVLAAVLATWVLQLADRSLRTAAAPNGIVSFELARDLGGVQAVLGSWDAQARVWAGFSLGFDYLYMLLYANALAAIILWMGGHVFSSQGRFPRWSLLLAWGMWVAALFDATENLALILLLQGQRAAFLPLLAWACALVKFGLLGLGGVVILAGLVRRLLARW